MGSLEVIIGSVFAGKTEALATQLRRLQVVYGNKGAVRAAKASIDDRYSETDVVSHSQLSIAAQPVKGTTDLRDYLGNGDGLRVLGVDEVQFFDSPIVDYLAELADKGVVVIASGLARDFRGEPFPFKKSQKGPFEPSSVTMAKLLGIADDITTAKAICTHPASAERVCGKPAYFTQRFVQGQPAHYSSPLIAIGAAAEGTSGVSYAARCRSHHVVPGHPKRST